MKITFDSENFLAGKGRSIGCVLLFIIAAFLIFQLGVSVGSHHAFRHHGFNGSGGYGMNGDQYYFTSSAAALDPSIDTQYGEAAGYSGDGMMTQGQISAQAVPASRMMIYRGGSQ